MSRQADVVGGGGACGPTSRGRRPPVRSMLSGDDPSLFIMLVPHQRHRRHRAAHRRLEEREERHVRGPGGAPSPRRPIGRQLCAPFADSVFGQIRPEQVCTPTDPGPVFMVVECPSEAFVEAVCGEQQLSR